MRKKLENDLFLCKNEIIACSNDEIDYLNRLVFENTGLKLPKAYIEFLELGGNRIGNVFSGMSIGFQHVVKRMEILYKNSANENTFDIGLQKGIIDKNALLFAYKESHPNKYSFFFLEDLDDPIVFEWWIGENEIISTNLKFSEYIFKEILIYEELRNKIPLKYRISLSKVKDKTLEIRKKLVNENSLGWRLLKQDLNSFLNKESEMIWNNSEQNEKLYIRFKNIFEELQNSMLPYILKTEGESNLFLEMKQSICEILEYFEE